MKSPFLHAFTAASKSETERSVLVKALLAQIRATALQMVGFAKRPKGTLN